MRACGALAAGCSTDPVLTNDLIDGSTRSVVLGEARQH